MSFNYDNYSKKVNVWYQKWIEKVIDRLTPEIRAYGNLYGDDRWTRVLLGFAHTPVSAPGDMSIRRISYYMRVNPYVEDLVTDNDFYALTRLMALDPTGAESLFIQNVENHLDFKKIETHPAGLGSKAKLFNEKILPKIIAIYAATQTDPALDVIEKRLIKDWWIKNKGDFPTTFVDDIASVQDLSWLKTFMTWTAGGMGANVQLYDKRQIPQPWQPFFARLAAGPGEEYAENMVVLEKLGFAEYLWNASTDGSQGERFSGAALDSDEGIRTFDQLMKYKNEENSKFGEIVTKALEIKEDLSGEDYTNMNQCGLITALIHDEFYFQKYIDQKQMMFDGLFYDSPLRFGVSGSNRIYPVKIKDYNPNKLVNNCVINKKVKNIFNTADTKTPHNMVKGMFWVYEDDNGDLREAELTTNSTVHRKKTSLVYQELRGDLEGTMDKIAKQAVAEGEGLTFSWEGEQHSNISRGLGLIHDTDRFEALDRIKDSSYYFLENTKINFDGTNPSTARNDVKVEMTWKLGSLEGLSSPLAILGKLDGRSDGTEITIVDLITLPLTGQPNSSNGAMSFLLNQYSPNYSRVRLKVAPYGDKDENHQKDCMILDLAIIDHKINRSSETGETSLTINYRGYFEQVMNQSYNDALTTRDQMRERKEARKRSLEILADPGNECDVNTVRSAIRLEQEISLKEDAYPSAGTILLRMKGIRAIHQYKLKEEAMRAASFGNLLDGRKQFVEKVSVKRGLALTTENMATLAQGSKTDNDDADDGAYKRLGDQIKERFFFIGDLMWVLLDCLYEEGEANHIESLKNLNLKFIMGTIYVPNPKDLGGPPITINPISIPVDLRFFVQWFNATIISKGLKFYPIGTFIRDLVGKLVNGIIYDTCFSLLLPDENPPQLRSTTFISGEKNWFKKNRDGWFDPTDPYQDGQPSEILFSKAFVGTRTDQPTNMWSRIVESTNYCVIYQQFPSYKRQLAAQDNGYLRDDEYTPTIYYGAKNKNYNFLSDVSFSKTNSPFLREARFFNTNNGGLSLLSNVYDLSFSFKRRKANTMFYPGCIINFVLLDWGQRWVDEPPWKDNGRGNIVHYFYDRNLTGPSQDTGLLSDSDPHKEGTMSNIMGMGGYFIVLSVEYNLGQTPGEFEINVTTKFLGTDASKPLIRTTDTIQVITDNAVCAAAYTATVDRYNSLIENNPDDNSEYALRAVVETDNTPTGQRVNQITTLQGATITKAEVPCSDEQEEAAAKAKIKKATAEAADTFDIYNKQDVEAEAPDAVEPSGNALTSLMEKYKK